jgi:hypothetical protein
MTGVLGDDFDDDTPIQNPERGSARTASRRTPTTDLSASVLRQPQCPTVLCGVGHEGKPVNRARCAVCQCDLACSDSVPPHTQRVASSQKAREELRLTMSRQRFSADPSERESIRNRERWHRANIHALESATRQLARGMASDPHS